MVWPLAGEAGTPTSLHRRPRVLAQGESPSHTPRDDARTRIRSDASFSSPFYTHTRRTSVRGFRTFHMIINGPAGLPPSRRSSNSPFPSGKFLSSLAVFLAFLVSLFRDRRASDSRPTRSSFPPPIPRRRRVKKKENETSTALGVPGRSPIQVLTEPDAA